MEVWKSRNLNYHLPSKLRISIQNYSDWIIYNDIFVRGEYDEPINNALDRMTMNSRSFNVLDLGANVGFFTLRVIDRMRERAMSAQCEFILVEGSPATFSILKQRLREQPSLPPHIAPILGLVGLPAGKGAIRQYDFHGENRLAAGRLSDGAVAVDYINLSEKVPMQPIDLLKCDIEGSEQAMLENYPDLLKKTRAAVFELHHMQCDTEKCFRLLKEAGFTRKTVLRETDLMSVCHFQR